MSQFREGVSPLSTVAHLAAVSYGVGVIGAFLNVVIILMLFVRP
jgi:hypothetical protein